MTFQDTYRSDWQELERVEEDRKLYEETLRRTLTEDEWDYYRENDSLPPRPTKPDDFKEKYIDPYITKNPQQAWFTLIPPDERPGAMLAFWHYRFLQDWRPSHDKNCQCGQPDDGEPAIPVPFSFSEIMVPG